MNMVRKLILQTQDESWLSKNIYSHIVLLRFVHTIQVKDTCKIKEQTTVYGTETAQKGTVQQSGKNGS